MTRNPNDLTPVQAQRSWDRQAEENVRTACMRIGLWPLAGSGQGSRNSGQQTLRSQQSGH